MYIIILVSNIIEYNIMLLFNIFNYLCYYCRIIQHFGNLLTHARRRMPYLHDIMNLG